MFDKDAFTKYYITGSGRFPELFDIFNYFTQNALPDISIKENSLSCLNETLSNNISFELSDYRYIYEKKELSYGDYFCQLYIYNNSTNQSNKFDKKVIVEANNSSLYEQRDITVVIFNDEGHMFVFMYHAINANNKNTDYKINIYHYLPETACYFDNYNDINREYILNAMKLGLLPDEESSDKVKFKSFEELFSNQEKYMDKYVQELKR